MPDPRLVELVGQRQVASVPDPSDPVFLVKAMFEEATAEALAKLSKVVTDAAEQIATTTVLSENAARTRSNKIITDAGQWSSDKIRLAGADAAATVTKRLEETVGRCEAAARVAAVTAWISGTAAAVCVVIVALMLVKVIPLP